MNTKLLLGVAISAVAMGLGFSAFAQAPTDFKRVEESDFGKLSDGTAIKAFTFTNAKGMKARVITYGAIIAGIQAPDKDGKLVNVVATADDAASMQRYGMKAYTVGRFANRIAGGKFPLEGAEITLPAAGRGGAVLHSGNANFGEKVWEGVALPPTAHEGAALMTYVSKDGDGGFPGTLTLKLTFSLNDDNEFKLAYEATTDKTTVINVTNHAYFNLSGAQGWGGTAMAQVTDHELWLDADQYLELANQVPTGKVLDVKETGFDFNKTTVIGSRAAQVRSYDHAFVLKNNGKMALVARLRDPKTGREMEVKTDQPGIQVFTGQRTAIALETQHHPDSPNHPNFPTTTLKPGEAFKTTTIYSFSAK